MLTADELALYVRPDYDATGNPLPDPRYSVFLGVVRDGEVLAYICLQLKLHAQPLVIKPGHAAMLPRLVAAAEDHILQTTGPQWVYLFAEDSLVKMATAMGMQLEPWHVLSKFVGPSKVQVLNPIESLSNAEGRAQ